MRDTLSLCILGFCRLRPDMDKHRSFLTGSLSRNTASNPVIFPFLGRVNKAALIQLEGS